MIQTIVNQPTLVVGDEVSKIKGYAFDGTVVAVFLTLSQYWRVVVEIPTRSGQGILHIFNEDQLEKRKEVEIPNHGPCAKCGLDVVHVYPWWIGGPNMVNKKPLHEECFKEMQE